MLNALELVNEAVLIGSQEIEILIDEKNKNEMMSLFQEFTVLKLNPEILERSSDFYLVVNVNSFFNKDKNKGNIIDISIKQHEKRKKNLIKI